MKLTVTTFQHLRLVKTANAYNNVQVQNYQLMVFVQITNNVQSIILIKMYMFKDFHNTESA